MVWVFCANLKRQALNLLRDLSTWVLLQIDNAEYNLGR